MRTHAMAVVAAVLLAGCTQYRAMRSDVHAVRVGLDSLNNALASHLTHQYELLRLVRADQQVRFNELERSIEALSADLSDSRARLSQIDEKTQELKKGWEEKARAESLAAVARLAEIEGLFNVAMGDFQAGRRTVAINGFADIVSRFPDSPKAAEARYWIGECQYAERDYAQAESTFSDYLRKHPGGNRTCGALLKLGLVYGAQKRIEARNTVWQKLLETCPGSEEAAVAEARLKGK